MIYGNRAVIDQTRPPKMDTSRFNKYIQRRGPPIVWDPVRLIPYYPILPKAIGTSGYDLHYGREVIKNVKTLPILNANIRDFLVEYPDQLPAWCTDTWWHYHALCFPATQFREHKGAWYAPYLSKRRGEIVPGDLLIDGCGWSSRFQIAIYIKDRTVNA